MEERLQKILAQAGLCSRREAEKWITDGRVTVNGRQAKPSTDVKPGDTLDLLLGGRHVVVRVESVAEHTRKEDAAAMYTLLSEG